MPILTKDDIRVFYIHIPKTGGTYIEDLFRANGFEVKFWEPHLFGGGLKCSPQHYHMDLIEKLFNLEHFDYVFATTRDPLGRFLSEFNMRNEQLQGNIEINSWTELVFEKYESNPFILDNHIRPQNEFLADDIPVYAQEDGFDSRFAKTLSKNIGTKLSVKKVESRRKTKTTTYKTIKSDANELTLSRILDFYEKDMGLA